MKRDPNLPGAEHLLGSGAAAVLEPAVAAAGGRLVGLQATEVGYTPGRRLVVRYGAEIEWSHGIRRVETLGAVRQVGRLPPGLAITEHRNGWQVGVWRYPHDPFLPGLPHAAYPEGVRRILATFGVEAGQVSVQPLVYRPGNRAVLRVRTDGLRLYLKVVRPGRVDRLRAVHACFAPRVPVPRCLGWSEPLGLVALQPLPGVLLTRPLVGGGRLPQSSELAALLRSVAGVPLTRQRRVQPAAVAGHHAHLLSAVLPEHAEVAKALAARVAGVPSGPARAVHGDFYDGQVLVTDGRISGLLDVDGAGLGGAHEDSATLVAHLLGLAHVHPSAAGRIDGYRAELTPLLAAGADRQQWRAAVLAVLLGLATTPFRRQEPDWAARTAGWLEVCRCWAEDRAG